MNLDFIKSLDKKYHTILNKYGVNTSLRKSHFWAQIYHESKCLPIQENLNYSTEGLIKVFNKYFLTKELANKYARKPEKIANRVYANRMGNGNEDSGDGYKYRGRGCVMITGKDNYIKLSKDTNINFLDNPDLLLQEVNSIISALWYWDKIKGNLFADKDDCLAITKLINGGFNGLKDRQKNVIELKKLFNENS